MLYDVFLDADVIISGSFSKTGAAHQLILFSELKLIHGLTNKQVIEECECNIENKLPLALNSFKNIINRSIDLIESPSDIDISTFNGYAHPKDLPILTTAILNSIPFFITFNIKHFHPLKECKTQILTPGRMLQQIRKDIQK